jgi:hypothetical protein
MSYTLKSPDLLIFNVATTDTTLASGINLFVVNQDHINVKHRGYVVTRGLSGVADLQDASSCLQPRGSITNT